MAVQSKSLIATHNPNDPFAPYIEFKIESTEYNTYVYIDWEVWYHANEDIYPSSKISSNVYAGIGDYGGNFEFIIGNEDEGVEGSPCVKTGSTSVGGSRCIATGNHSIEKKVDAGQDIEIYLFFAFDGIKWYDNDIQSDVILDVVEARDYMGINHIGFDPNGAAITYVVRYNKNYGDYGNYGTFTKVMGVDYQLSFKPVREGYTFKGWSLLSDSGVVSFEYNDIYDLDRHDVALYAVWESLPTYTISFDTNGGSGNFDPIIKRQGEAISLPTDKPIRDGYIFVGWAESFADSEIFQPESKYIYEGDTTLYAVWFPVTYTITYDANGGKKDFSNQKRYHGTISYITTKKPYRNGYKFLGWSDSPNGKVVYESGDECTINASFTLYAVWEESDTNIKGIVSYRCDEKGNKQAEGKYVRIEFNYLSIGITSDVRVEWKCDSDFEEYDTSRFEFMRIDDGVVLPGKFGIFDAVLDNAFDSNKTYTFRIKVYDTGCEYNQEEGANVAMEETIISNVNYFMDFKAPETTDEIGSMGIGVEASEDEDGTLKIGFPTRFVGGILYTDLPGSVDFNTLIIPNNYVLSVDEDYGSICPITTDGTLLVEPVGNNGVRQVVIGDNSIRYERYYTIADDSWNDWVITYIPDAEKVYTATKSVMIENGDIDNGQVVGATIVVPKGVYVVTGEARIGTADLSSVEEIASTPRNNQVRLYAKPDGASSSMMISMERNYATQSNFLVMTISTIYKADKTTTIAIAKSSSVAERLVDKNTAYQDTIITAVRIA